MEKDKLRGIIAEIVREEIEAMVNEAKEEIREIVRSNFSLMLRSAIRESILKELEEAASSEDELPKTAKVGGDQGVGLYLYGIADADAQTELGQIGIEENAVYTIPSGELSAIVHNCPLEPYNSEDKEIVKGWVNTHQHVLDVATEKFGAVIPFGFDRIIKPEGENNAEEILKKWISEEFNSLKVKMEKIRGKKEYGVQIFYIPSVVSKKIAEENEEIKKIKEEMKLKSPGAAYMYKKKLENAIKKEMETRMDSYFREFYEKIRSRTQVEDIKVEKVKEAEKDKVMIMNLSALTSDEKALGSVLEEIDNEEGFSVRFTGPWQPYSFV